MEKTFAMIKPDAVLWDNIGEIIYRIERAGFSIKRMMMKTLDQPTAEKFYAEHKGKDYFEGLVKFMVSGPVVGIELDAYNPAGTPDAVERFRELIGNTYPSKAATGTLRADFGTGAPNNAIHGSDSDISAVRELQIFFEEEE